MRIKWNRHLDGTSSRRPEDDAPPQESKENKDGKESKKSILRIFRRKKHPKGEKNLSNEVPGLEEEDNASVSSVATCSSQTVPDGFHRDRSHSLFSSFRLSLPGYRRKKRKITPVNSDTLFTTTEDVPQIERYSTPDLRKHSDVPGATGDINSSLSTSSPSVRYQKSPGSILHSEPDNAAAPRLKLSKSVSFSNCRGDSADVLPSRSPAVSEGEAPKSEHPVRLSGNPTGNCESNFPSLDGSATDAKAVVASDMTKTVVENRPSPCSVSKRISEINSILSDITSEICTYEYRDSSARSPLNEKCQSVVSHLSDISNNHLDNSLPTVKIAKSSDPSHSGLKYHQSSPLNGLSSDSFPVRDITNERKTSVDRFPLTSVKCEFVPEVTFHASEIPRHIPTDTPERLEVVESLDSLRFKNLQLSTANGLDCDSSPVCVSACKSDYSQRNTLDDSKEMQNRDVKDINTFDASLQNDSVSPNASYILPQITPANISDESKIGININNFSRLDCNLLPNFQNFDNSAINSNECSSPKYPVSVANLSSVLNSVERNNGTYDSDNTDIKDKTCKYDIKGSKHVLCRLKVIETVPDGNTCHSDSLSSKNLSDKNKLDTNFDILNRNISNNNQNSCTDVHSNENFKYDNFSKSLTSLNSFGSKEFLKDQEILDICGEYSLDRKKCKSAENHGDQRVPEFELSLLEFEEMCNKYASVSNETNFFNYDLISDCSISPKLKSVLDLSFPLRFQELDDIEILKTLNAGMKSAICNGTHNEVVRSEVKINKPNSPESQKVSKQYSLPLPPKQWINYENSDENEYLRDAVTNGVQCTKVRGKNLCQEPSLEALPITVMHGETDADMPQLLSTAETFENQGGSEGMLDKVSLDSDGKDMNVDILQDGVGDSDPMNASPVYLDSTMRDNRHDLRVICDPLTFSSDVVKRRGNYLGSHNFCDNVGVNFTECINEIRSDYLPLGNGLIEISNPYQEDELFEVAPKFSDAKDKMCNDHQGSTANSNLSSSSLKFRECVVNGMTNGDGSLEEADMKMSNSDSMYIESSNCNGLANDDITKESEFSHADQKNFVNKCKSSMIPCLKRSNTNDDIKRQKSKLKPKKSEFPGQIESILPVKNTNISRFCNKDGSNAKHLLLKQKKNGVVNGSSSSRKFDSLSNNSEIDASESLSENDQNTALSKNDDNYVENANTSLPQFIVESYNLNHVDRNCEVAFSDSLQKDKDNSENNSDDHTLLIHKRDINGVKISDVSPLQSTDENHFVHDADKSDDMVPQNSFLKDGTDIETQVVDGEISLLSANDHFPADKIGTFSENHSEYADSECNLSGKIRQPLDYSLGNRRLSLPAVVTLNRNLTSSKESLNSQLTDVSKSNKEKSRIPRKQPSSRGSHASKGPVRPPMWLSKAELTQEIQRLGTLCEARTKELNRLKMETKHVTTGFDAFASLFRYMVEDLNALSIPKLNKDLEKSLKQLELTKQDLAFYEREVEELKAHHCQELNDLSNKLFEVYQSEVAELNAKHTEEINHLKSDHQIQKEHLIASFNATSEEAVAIHKKQLASLEQEILKEKEVNNSHQEEITRLKNEHQKQMEELSTQFHVASEEVKVRHEKIIATLELELVNQREELESYQQRELKDLEAKHTESIKVLQEHIDQLQKKCAELKLHSLGMEDAMQKDTDSKLQWVTAQKIDLDKEVESLKAVLEMKNKELHSLRVQNLEMEKQLEDLPLLREKIKMYRARAEDLEALMLEKTKIERKLSTENQQIRDTYEKEAKVNRRLSMENEELQWRLRQAENSLISGSFTEVPESAEEETENPTSPVKSPASQVMTRSVFFTYVDANESTPDSPRNQYKKVTPGFSSNYKASPAKSCRSPPAPSPRKAKSHSEPPNPPPGLCSTPKRVGKQPLSKAKGSQKRQRASSDSSKALAEQTETNTVSMTGSMASSVSSESSVFEHKERLLEEHKEHIVQTLEILREQRSIEKEETYSLGKKWCSDDLKVGTELSKLESEDLSRSAEFSDIKTYYHMTFPLIKEGGDVDESARSSGNSPLAAVARTKHSMSEGNINYSIDSRGKMTPNVHTLSQKVQSVDVVLKKSADVNKETVESAAQSHWRTI